MPRPRNVRLLGERVFEGFVSWWAGSRDTARRDTRVLTVLLVLVCAAVAIVGVPRLHIFGHDIFVSLDGGWRVLNGQRPGVDFYGQMGPVYYLLHAVGLWLAGNNAPRFRVRQHPCHRSDQFLGLFRASAAHEARSVFRGLPLPGATRRRSVSAWLHSPAGRFRHEAQPLGLRPDRPGAARVVPAAGRRQSQAPVRWRLLHRAGMRPAAVSEDQLRAGGVDDRGRLVTAALRLAHPSGWNGGGLRRPQYSDDGLSALRPVRADARIPAAGRREGRRD